MLEFDELINKNVKNPIIFCGIINNKFDYNFYINLKNTLKQKYNIAPYFVIFENLPDINDEEYYYTVLNKVEEMNNNTFKIWMDYNELEIFYFGEYNIFKHFYEILIHTINKKVNFHFINSNKNKKQNQVSFMINFNLNKGN